MTPAARRACRRVKVVSNKGVPGPDGQTVDPARDAQQLTRARMLEPWCCQSTASATNDTTSTIDAPHANSQLGTGKSERPTSPCAEALAGRTAAANAAAPRARLNGRATVRAAQLT